MKKIVIALVLAMVLLIGSVIPVSAATYEEWDLAAYQDGISRVTMTIATTTLKTDHFDVYNNSPTYSVDLFVVYNGSVVWSITVPPNTNREYVYTMNFYRLPRTDPDNPDSIRYPNGYGIGTRHYVAQ